MKIELYLQCGIVESYALGLASPVEAAEFEQLLPHFPELKDALSEFEYHLELFAIDSEIPPPPDIRKKIQDRLRERRGEGVIDIDVAPSNQIRVHKYWRGAFIAVFILAKIFLGLSIYYFLENRQAREEIIQLQHEVKPK